VTRPRTLFPVWRGLTQLYICVRERRVFTSAIFQMAVRNGIAVCINIDVFLEIDQWSTQYKVKAVD